jgi:membrane protein
MTEAWRRRGVPRKGGLSVQATAAPETFDAAEPGHGRLAPGPHRIPPRGWRDVVWRVWLEINRDRLTVVAASVTFYSLLAIFPAIGVFVAIYGIFADVNAVREQLNDLAAVMPSGVVSLIGDQMMRLAQRPSASLSFAFAINLLLSVWSANAGMKSLFDGLNIAYDETEKRNIIKLTLLTYGFTFGALIFVTLVAAILVAAPLAFAFLGLARFEDVWAPMRWLLLFAVASTAFSVIYRFAPCRRHARWRWVTPGGVFAAGFWLVGSLGFSWYVNNFANYDVTYGSLGAVIGFMMWIWFSVMVILIGGELNAEIEHQTARDSTTGVEKPMGARGAVMADTVGLSFDLRFTKMARDVLSGGRDRVDRVLKRGQANSSSSAAKRAA